MHICVIVPASLRLLYFVRGGKWSYIRNQQVKALLMSVRHRESSFKQSRAYRKDRKWHKSTWHGEKPRFHKPKALRPTTASKPRQLEMSLQLHCKQRSPSYKTDTHTLLDWRDRQGQEYSGNTCKTETLSNHRKQSGQDLRPAVERVLTFLTSLTKWYNVFEGPCLW
jgi:hypothetical protein